MILNAIGDFPYDESHAGDILAPKRVKHPFTVMYKRMPEFSQQYLAYAAQAFGMSVFLFLVVITLPHILQSHAETWQHIVGVGGVVCGVGGLLTLLAALIYLGYQDDPISGNTSYRIYDNDPTQYNTLFREGDTPLFTDQRYSTYTVRVPRGLAWNAERSVRFMEQLTYSFQPLLFRMTADHKGIAWQVVDLHGRDPHMIESAIRIIYPEAQVTVETAHDLTALTHEMFRLTLVYHPIDSFVHPFKFAKEVKEFDPLTALTGAMNELRPGERASVNMFVVGAHPTAHEEGKKLTTTSIIRPTDYFSAQGLRLVYELKRNNLDRVPTYVPRDQKIVEEKLRNLLYQAVFMVQIDSQEKERITTIGEMIDSQMFGFAHMPYNALRWYTGMKTEDEKRQPPDINDLILHLKPSSDPLRGSAIDRILQYAESNTYANARWATRLILSTQELALFWHLPDERFTASRIKWLSSRTVPPPPVVTQEVYGLRLGYGTSGGQIFPIILPIQDREGHVRVLGKTGAGKSSLLQDYIRQDIAAGRGLTVIDPHGSLIEQVLEHCVHPSERERVVILDLADRKNPPPLNPLRGGVLDIQVGHIVHSIQQMYPTTSQLARLNHYLRTALLTLNADPQSTVRDVVRLFKDKDYRHSLISTLSEDDLRETWEEYENMREAEKRTITDPIRNRLSPFYTNPHLFPIMCHPDGIPFERYIKERKIILISLKMDERLVPETERNLIGTLLLSRLQVSGMQQETNRIPHYVYIDEVQRFVTSSLDEMLSEARKFGLSITFAHQFLDQLPQRTQSSMISNVGATVLFASSPEDAQTFLPHTRPYFDEDDIVALNQFTSVARIQHHGTTQPAFTLLTPLPQGLTYDDISSNPVFRQRKAFHQDLIPTTTVHDAWQQILAKHPEAHGSPSTWMRLHSHHAFTPKTMDEVSVWLKQRYGRKVKEDTQGLYLDE